MQTMVVKLDHLTAQTAYGEYGLVANGSDPNEVPDAVTLRDNMVKVAKTAEAAVTLSFADVITVLAVGGTTATQAVSGATGTVVFETRGKKVYLKDVTGTFDTTNAVTIGSTNEGVPTDVNAGGLLLAATQLSVYGFDTDHRHRIEVKLTSYTLTVNTEDTKF